MSLTEFQRALADLIASPELCLELRADPPRVLAGYALSGRERRRLEAVTHQRGMSVSCTLYRVNRITPIYSMLPLTCELLGDQLLAVVTDFWHEMDTDLQSRREIDRFEGFLLARLAAGRIDNPYVAEVLAFEVAANTLRFLPRRRIRQELAEGARRPRQLHPLVRVVRFEHEPLSLLEPLAGRRPPPAGLPRSESHLLLDGRTGGNDDLALEMLEPETGRVLLELHEGRLPDEATLAALAAADLVVGDLRPGAP